MIKDKSLIQSCIDHINTAIDVDPWAKELVAEMGKEILKAQLSKEDTTSDCISRQEAIDICHKNYDGILDFRSDGWTVASSFEDIINSVPSVQPYTDEEIQKMQDMEQAEIEKAFELGQESAKAEIVRCKDCRHSEHWYGDKSRCFLWHEEGIDVFEDGFCNYAERRTDD